MLKHYCDAVCPTYHEYSHPHAGDVALEKEALTRPFGHVGGVGHPGEADDEERQADIARPS